MGIDQMSFHLTLPGGPAAVDFETYYDKDVSIKTMGVDAYLRHPLCDIYLVAIVGDEGEEFVGHPSEFDWASLEGRELWSHNAGFDRRVYHYLRDRSTVEVLEYDTSNGGPPSFYEVSYALPDLETPRWNCTANLSTYLRTGRSLKSAVKNLFNKEVSKDIRDKMRGKTVEVMKTTAATDPQYLTFYDEVCAYALADAWWCKQIAFNHAKDWPEFEQKLSLLTIESCHEGIPLDVPYLENGKQLLETKRWEIEQSLPWVKEGHKPTSPKALAEWCRKVEIPCPPSTDKEDEEFIAWGEEYGTQYPWVENITNWRKANKMLKSIEKLLDRQHNGIFSYGLKYMGAHTGRWSGDAGFNVQNPEKEPVFGFSIRHSFHAQEDCVLITADLAQIEARLTPYLAEDWETIEAIANGMSIYEVYARQRGWVGGNLKKEDPAYYAYNKACVLALGFGCRWKKFQIMAKQKKFGRIILTMAEAKRAINQFERRRFIPDLWDRLEADFKASVGEDFELVLPSNRVMTYFDVLSSEKEVEVVNARSGQISKKKRTALQACTEMGGRPAWYYGGKLCENLVQGSARDVFGEGLVRIDETIREESFRLLFHSHDEGNWQAPRRKAQEIAEEIQRLLCVTPAWLPGCPISAETTIAEKYEK
jgi:hypothetical protein